ncbi:MAG: alpha/beta hydrolase [Thermomicrobiales bacterium]|nr:alpha/beta hydrolase [Thermomicrobiales bacterium]
MTAPSVAAPLARERPVFRCALLMLGLVLTLMLVSATASAAQTTAAEAASPSAAEGDFAGLVDIGAGRRLWLECRGRGSPTVLLEAGTGNDADTWDAAGLAAGAQPPAVLPGVATFTRVCAYDRPGTLLDADRPGRSDPAPMPRTTAQMVADLHALLGAAQVPGPYVIVAHSFGGLVARLYAATYPADVAGLVLVDAAHEDYYAHLRAALMPAQWAAATGAIAPAGSNAERIDTTASAAQMRRAAAAAPLPDLPLVVITHGRPWAWPAGYPADALEALWMPLQRKLAALTPDAQLTIACDSDHDIPGEQPGLIVAAVRQVIAAVRDPASWPPQHALPAPDEAACHGRASVRTMSP